MALVCLFGLYATSDFRYLTGGLLELFAVCGRRLELYGRMRSVLKVDMVDWRSGYRLTGVALQLTFEAIPRKTVRTRFMAFFFRKTIPR